MSIFFNNATIEFPNNQLRAYFINFYVSSFVENNVEYIRVFNEDYDFTRRINLNENELQNIEIINEIILNYLHFLNQFNNIRFDRVFHPGVIFDYFIIRNLPIPNLKFSYKVSLI